MNARDLAVQYAGWDVSAWFPALGRSLRGTIAGYRDGTSPDILLLAHPSGRAQKHAHDVLILPSSSWHTVELRHLRSLPLRKTQGTLRGRRPGARPGGVAPPAADRDGYPHDCPRCGHPALVLFTSTECSNPTCCLRPPA